MNDSLKRTERQRLSRGIKDFAKKIGIDLIGFTPAVFDHEGLEHLANFIEKERQGDMRYLEDFKKRIDPNTLLPGARSVIVIAINYFREQKPVPKGHGRIARYANGRDYHKVLKKLLKQLAAFIEEQEPPARTRLCVDSAPLLEKAYAVRAGLGFIGKNTTLITPQYGSYVLLGEILTDIELEYDQATAGTCGTCTRCIDACPTRAFAAPRELDAKRCISYLTIEHKGPIPEEFHKPMANWIFGCDICQEVCPYNKQFAKPLQLEAFKKVTIAGSSIPLDEILAIQTDDEYVARFAGSPLMRAKRAGLRRNAGIAKKNEA